MKKIDCDIYKALYRNKLRIKIRKISLPVRKQKSRVVIHNILRHQVFKQSQRVLIYYALSDEVDTRHLIKEALKKGKEVYLPKVDLRRKKMIPVSIHHPFKGLKRGTYGIMEPVKSVRKSDSSAQCDLLLVPGLGFDRRGGRLGRGEGYFDKYLAQRGQACVLGVSYQEQVLGKVPVCDGDQKVDGLVTDEGVNLFKKRRSAP